MSQKIRKEDIGEQIRSKLIRPMMVLEMLQKCSRGKSPNQMGKFLGLAKEDMVSIFDLSLTIEETKYKSAIAKKLKLEFKSIRKKVK